MSWKERIPTIARLVWNELRTPVIVVFLATFMVEGVLGQHQRKQLLEANLQRDKAAESLTSCMAENVDLKRRNDNYTKVIYKLIKPPVNPNSPTHIPGASKP